MKLSLVVLSMFFGTILGGSIAFSEASVPVSRSEASPPALSPAESVSLPEVIEVPEQYIVTSAPKPVHHERVLVCGHEFATLGGTVQTCWWQ